MARARNIKPGFFKNEFLAEMSAETRLLFIGLWTLADREGRLEDRPKRIKAELFAFDMFDVDSMLNRLQDDGFVVRYEVEGQKLIEVCNFVKHQDPHYREKASELPPPPGRENLVKANGVTRNQRKRIFERDGFKCQSCGSIEHLCIDHILPVSRGGTSDDDNLQALCLPCNTTKGNRLDGETSQIRRPKSPVLPSFESSSTQRRLDVESSSVPPVPLIPDSLIPDSGFLIPEKNTMSGKPDPRKQAVSVLEYLNAKTGRKYQAVDANTKIISARLKEGASIEECKAVIDLKTAEWSSDVKMCEFLRPETLFNATKFAGYVGRLGERPIVHRQQSTIPPERL